MRGELELLEHRYRLFLALVKIYDNYITPLGCNVKCWKYKLDDKWFILGMTAIKPYFEADKSPDSYDISYRLPIKYWHLAKVIECKPRARGNSKDNLERLLRL